jgi:ABC-type transporter Mla MlaB component
MEQTFDFGMIEHLFPEYLTKTEKGRLLQALEQFKEDKTKNRWNSKIYSHFYAPVNYPYFLQGDLVREIRYPMWDYSDRTFKKTFTDAIILSNTCDLDISNLRKIHKQVILAPLLELQDYIDEMTQIEVNIEETLQNIKTQSTSNIIYLPSNLSNGKDYICHLDKAFWFPTEELNSYLAEIDKTRIASLDYFGYYLFLVKLSYHFCRLPEEKQR